MIASRSSSLVHMHSNQNGVKAVDYVSMHKDPSRAQYSKMGVLMIAKLLYAGF
jgi:hypothetical protein